MASPRCNREKIRYADLLGWEGRSGLRKLPGGIMCAMFSGVGYMLCISPCVYNVFSYPDIPMIKLNL